MLESVAELKIEDGRVVCAFDEVSEPVCAVALLVEVRTVEADEETVWDEAERVTVTEVLLVKVGTITDEVDIDAIMDVTSVLVD